MRNKMRIKKKKKNNVNRVGVDDANEELRVLCDRPIQHFA